MATGIGRLCYIPKSEVHGRKDLVVVGWGKGPKIKEMCGGFSLYRFHYVNACRIRIGDADASLKV